MRYHAAVMPVLVSRHSIRTGAKKTMQEIGLVATVEQQAKTIRIKYVADLEDPGQRILTRAAKTGRGIKRRFRIGHEEFEGLLKSIKQERFLMRDPLAILQYTATIQRASANGTGSHD